MSCLPSSATSEVVSASVETPEPANSTSELAASGSVVILRPISKPKQVGRPMRRARMSMSKAAVMSPEARRAADERDRRMIEEFIAQGRVTKLEPRWAFNSVPMNAFGVDG